MARNVEPYVILIAKTQIIPPAISKWLIKLGVGDEAIHKILDFNKSDAEALIEVAGRRCYMAFQPGLNPNVTKIRKDISDYITNLLDKKDGSVLEHATFSFAIENVSRVFTGEMNRHRAGMALSEGSMRYIRYTDTPYWIPTSIQRDETPMTGTRPERQSTDYDKRKPFDFDFKEEAHRASLRRVFEFAQKEYMIQQEIWKEELNSPNFAKKKDITSCMRRSIPMGVSTGGIWTGNIRALRHIFEMRCSEFAEEEILLVATMMLNELKANYPTFFGDFNTNEFGFSKPKYSKV